MNLVPPSLVRHLLLLALANVAVGGCSRSNLRGKVSKSADGRTHLAIDNDQGGGCPVEVDYKLWHAPLGVASEVTPGRHVIRLRCEGRADSGLQVVLSQGDTLHFDYWGP